VEKYMCQWGLIDGESKKKWIFRAMLDEPIVHEHKRGTIAFAKSGGTTNSRATQLYINKIDNPGFNGKPGLVPFGEVVEGMEVVDALTMFPQMIEVGRIVEDGPPFLASIKLGGHPVDFSFIQEATFVEGG
jgi:cyclophilin family peptidyl-prolyl cis-trans isomerase